MKKIYFFIVALMLCLSCSKEHFDSVEASYIPVVDTESAMSNFSIALSKVLFNSQESRQLIKREAQKRFDNDYDVLYAFVKNVKVCGEKTFRDLLIDAMGSEKLLLDIEHYVPALSIYVPDLTWIDESGFNVDVWNTKNNMVAITYKEGRGVCKKLYANGYFAGLIDDGTVPGGVVLIVKNNERIKNVISTKSGMTKFEFIDEVFDGSNVEETKSVRYTGKYTSSWIQGQSACSSSDFIDVNLLKKYCPEIVEAADIYRDDKYGCQNDYIFYGLTSNNARGKLRNDLRSRVIRFKISPSSFNAIFDDSVNTSKKDRNFVDVFDTDDGGDKHKSEPSVSDIYSKLWADGALEIKFTVFVNDGSDQVSSYRQYVDVKAKDLFTVKEKSIKREQWGSTAIKWYRTWRYSIAKRDATTLESKWYYLEKAIELPQWDLINNSGYYILVSEVDSGATIQETISVTTKRSKTSSGKVFVDDTNSDDVYKTELGWSISDESSSVTNYVITRKEDDDELCRLLVRYSDNYATPTANPNTYTLHSYGTSRFTFVVLPCNYYEN